MVQKGLIWKCQPFELRVFFHSLLYLPIQDTLDPFFLTFDYIFFPHYSLSEL